MTVASTELFHANTTFLKPNAELLNDATHFVNKRSMLPPYVNEQEALPELEEVMLGLGCFWGAERKFWNTPGVFTTAVGYAAGHTDNASYQAVCSGATGHAEVVLVVFDRQQTSLEKILKVFFESHDPTQGMRQGNDIGTQYRSGIYCLQPSQVDIATELLNAYQQALTAQGYGDVTTEIKLEKTLNYAEDYHQQYLAKNPDGYCGIGGTGVQCAI